MPMKDKLKEWKETLDYLDTKHNKESKRRVEEVKKAVSETERLKKKVVKKGLWDQFPRPLPIAHLKKMPIDIEIEGKSEYSR